MDIKTSIVTGIAINHGLDAECILEREKEETAERRYIIPIERK